MKLLTGADEQIAAYCFKMPFVFHLIEEVSRNFALRAVPNDIDHSKSGVELFTAYGCEVLPLDGQMRHPVDQAFTQRTPPGTSTEYSVG
ncbi:hypothetical protein ACNKHU_23790 [Shigella flexneri]